MSANENASKISLSMLRGKSSNQSVPSISFRFNPGSDDLIKVDDNEEKEDLLTCVIPEVSPDKPKNILESEHSLLRRDSRSLNQRSSSLDDATVVSQETPITKLADTSSLISRITKTFEHKINEIRSDKHKDSKLAHNKDGTDQSSAEQYSISSGSESEKTGSSYSSTTKALDNMKRFSIESRENVETSSSPSKTKTSLVQDFTEQTNKLKSDFNKTIRPKISELRNRKSAKDNTSSPKIRSSIFQSLLGRDDGITPDELLQECHAIDSAVEAHEDVPLPVLVDQKKASPMKQSAPLEQINITKSPSEDLLPPESQKEPRSCKETVPETPDINLKLILLQFVQEVLVKRKSMSTKYGLAFILICFILPIPRFIAGIIFGAGVVSVAFFFLLKIILPVQEEESTSDEEISSANGLGNEDNSLYVGWMNKLDGDYYPESYHVSQTHTVLLRLQGSTLQIDNSRKKISKHARPNEDLKCGAFVHHREYDLAGCEVVLLPKNLPRKWLWSRKYPIFIRLHEKPPQSSSPESIPSTPNKSFHDPSSRPHSPEDLAGSSESTEGNWSLDNNASATSAAEDDVMSSSLDLGSYEEVTQDMCLEMSLCLFARTDREKDDWYRRFVSSSERKSADNQRGGSLSSPLLFTSSTPEAEVSVPFEVSPHVPPAAGEPEPEQSPEAEEDRKAKPLSFEQHMARILQHDTQAEAGVSWFNTFAGRILFDFLHNQYWGNKIQERVQRKLSKLHIPYFVGEIVVSGVELGNCVPQLLSAERPTTDERGLWVDMSVAYSGSFRMTLETKLDLMKLKMKSPSGAPVGVSSPPSPSEAPSSSSPYTAGRTRSYARSPSSDCVLRNVQFDTDTDDSVESSSEEDATDDELRDRGGVGGGASGPASKRFLRIVDTVAASRYFQQASEWRVLQRAMKGVSNTRIELGVEVKRLKGTLTINIPPAPADRLWYGFRGSPELVMVAKPCLGDRQLDTLPFLADFIQKQLRTVFEKVFVLPNMDDLVIPIMSPLLPGQKHPLRPPWDHQSTPSPKTSPSRANMALDLNQSFLKLTKTAQEV